MTDWHSLLMAQFPKRMTAAEKAAAREWLKAQITEMGYAVAEETNGRTHNLVIGQPEQCPVLFVAHYDTPARTLLPQTQYPTNWALFLLWQALQLLLLLLPAVAIYVLAYSLTGLVRLAFGCFLLTYVLLLLRRRWGPGNAPNANAGTSGLAVALSLLEAVPAERRQRIAVVLLDGGEVGHTGARAWGKAHMQLAYTRLTVALDCLGHGRTLLFAATSLAKKCTGYGSLCRCLATIPGISLREANTKAVTLTGDHAAFKCGTVLCACEQRRLVGLRIPHLCTPADRQADSAQLQAIGEALARCAAVM